MEQRSSNLEPGDTLSEIYCYQRMWTVLLEATSIMRYSKLYIIIIIIKVKTMQNISCSVYLWNVFIKYFL